MNDRIKDKIRTSWLPVSRAMPYYPSSFLKLIVIGFLLVAVPLALGLVNSAISIDRLASQSQRVVYQSAEAAKDARILIDEITTMERRLRQAIILNDLALLEGYRHSHARFIEAMRRLTQLPLQAEHAQLVDDLKQAEEATYQLVINAPSTDAAQVIAREYPELENIARQISTATNALIEREIKTMQELSARTLRFTQWQLLALIPIALFLVSGFILLIARPIRQIESAIRQIGRGDLTGEIVVDGPQDLRYLGSRLNQMRQHLRELEEQKTRFLRQLSHELKTPLSALREGTELLSEGVLGTISVEQRQVVDILKNSSIKLQRLIEDLLSYDNLRQHPLILKKHRVELRPILAQILLDQKLTIRNKQLSIQIMGNDVSFIADEERIRTLMDNLISNAIKFSPPHGRIELIIGHQNAKVTFDIVDEGPGIAAEERDKIFEPFYQGQALSDGYIKGTGLGLSIARELVQAHGGDITVLDSARGAHFRVTLPDIASGTSP